MNEIRKQINELKRITSKMPKTIKEAVEFPEQELTDQDFGFEEEMPMEEPMSEIPESPMEEPINTPEMNDNAQEGTLGANGMAIIDDIRKLALKTMADLADNPEDPAYVILKKVWQMCDKKPEDQNKMPSE